MASTIPIAPNEKAAKLEAFHAALEIIQEEYRGSFVLVGGTSLGPLTLGGNRKTADVDIAVTAEALHAFFEAAENDPRFTKDFSDNWEYKSSFDTTVPFEFLIQGGGFVPILRNVERFGSNGGPSVG